MHFLHQSLQLRHDFLVSQGSKVGSLNQTLVVLLQACQMDWVQAEGAKRKPHVVIFISKLTGMSEKISTLHLPPSRYHDSDLASVMALTLSIQER
jgi:hypothetical protein